VPSRRLLALGFAALAIAGCGTASEHTIKASGLLSSWVQGQQSLSSSAAFLEIDQRAEQLAARRTAARQQELVLLAAERLAAKRHARSDALRRYQEARRAAIAAYHVALHKAALAKARQEAALAEARRKRAALLRAMLKAREVKPGQECSMAVVRAQFNCMTGHLPGR